MRQGIHLPPATAVQASTRAMGREKRRAVAKRQRRKLLVAAAIPKPRRKHGKEAYVTIPGQTALHEED